MDSRKYDLNLKDLKDIGIMGLAAVISYIITQVIPVVNFGKYQGIVTVTLPVITYMFKKWQQGK